MENQQKPKTNNGSDQMQEPFGVVNVAELKKSNKQKSKEAEEKNNQLEKNAKKNQPPQQDNKINAFGVVNIKEMKKKKVPKKGDEHLWHNQLKNWLLAGGGVGLFFLLLGIVNFDFIFIAPLAPFLAFVAWYMRQIFRRYGLDEEKWLE